MIRVLIADDQDLVREGLRMLLEAEPDLAVAGEAGDGGQALAQARLLDPDVILMDVRMPGMNGIEATSRLVQAGSRARILMLTTFNLDEYVYQALKAGASGFLLKDASREQLTGAVRAVAAGETLLAPAITRRLIEDFCRDPAPGSAPAATAGRLSERELDVVRLVAQGLSNAEIAARLYLSEATVKSHIARILAKLGLRDRVQIAVHAYENGIVRPGQAIPPAGPGNTTLARSSISGTTRKTDLLVPIPRRRFQAMTRCGLDATAERPAVADLGDVEAAATVGLVRAVLLPPGEGVEPPRPVVGVQHPQDRVCVAETDQSRDRAAHQGAPGARVPGVRVCVDGEDLACHSRIGIAVPGGTERREASDFATLRCHDEDATP